MFRVYEGKNHAKLYRMFRQNTPNFVIQKIIKYMQSHNPEQPDVKFGVALDMGCGSGQNTLPLAPHFERVLGCDVSEAQIDEARQLPVPDNVTYVVAPAHQLPAADRSVQLVTGSLSFHLVELDPFYAEVDRILTSGGVVAAVGHAALVTVVHEKGQELNRLLEDFFEQNMERGKHSVYTSTAYKTLPLPYKDEVRMDDLFLEINKSLAEVLGALSAKAAFQKAREKNPQKVDDAVHDFRQEFLRVLGKDINTPPETVSLIVRYQYFLALCTKP